MPPKTPRSVDRRTLLGAGVAVALVTTTGCISRRTPVAQRTIQSHMVTPDVATAVALVARLSDSLSTIDRLHRHQSRRFAALARVERAHLNRLRGAVPEGIRQQKSARSRLRATPTVVLADTHTLHRAVSHAALRAESGEFARLLGSMSAALSQQLYLLESP